MNLSLLHIPPSGQSFEHRYAPDELDVSMHRFALGEAPHITGRVKQSGQDFHVSGELKAALTISCDRCLRDLFIAVNESFKLVYAPASEARGQHGEREINQQELEFAYLESEDLDIDQLIREQLELVLPVRLLCHAECRGLCVQCGTDLNESECQCVAPVDLRWQALADLPKKNN